MKVKLIDIVDNLKSEVRSGENLLDREVTGGYTSDLLSDVLANANPANVWITLQTHLNIIAVANIKDLAAIIIVNQRIPDEDTLKKAFDENIPILITEKSAFEVSGLIYNLLTR